jgi:hypothetical protein
MKTVETVVTRMIKGGILFLIALSCLFVGVVSYDALKTVASGKSVVIESSDGAVVKITNVRKNAVEFISGTGGVTAFSPELVPVAGAIFILISLLAVFGSFSLLKGNGQPRLGVREQVADGT